MSLLISYIKQYINLSEEAEQEIKDLVYLEKLNKGYLSLQKGKTCNSSYFFAKEIFRTLYTWLLHRD